MSGESRPFGPGTQGRRTESTTCEKWSAASAEKCGTLKAISANRIADGCRKLGSARTKMGIFAGYVRS